MLNQGPCIFSFSHAAGGQQASAGHQSFHQLPLSCSSMSLGETAAVILCYKFYVFSSCAIFVAILVPFVSKSSTALSLIFFFLLVVAAVKADVFRNFFVRSLLL